METLVQQAIAVAVEPEHLHPVLALVDEQKQCTALLLDHLFDDGFILMNTCSGALSTAMSTKHIDMLAESLLCGFRKIRDLGGVAWALERVAAVSAAEGFPERAARQLGASLGLRRQAGSVRPPVDEPGFRQLSDRLSDELGGERLAALQQEGAELDYDGAAALGGER